VNRPTRIILVLLVGIAVSGLVSYLVYQRVLRPAQAREEAFVALREGQLSPGPGGVTELPPRWSVGSSDGKAYVTGRPTGTMWVLFPTSSRDGASFGGHLLCTRPNQTAPGSTVELESTPTGRPATMKIVRAFSPFSFDVVSEK
jgi:hypothetical protein